MENNETGKKRKAIDESPSLNLIVKAQEGRECHFRIRADDPLFKLMKSYSDRRLIDFKTIRFFYNGLPILPKATANSLHMEDGDEIDAMFEQLGGGGWRSF